MYKKILSWILTFIMIFSMFGGMNLEVFGQSFNDIEEHWAKANIDEWFQKGLINGYSDGTFKPNGHITRAEFITLINNVINIQQEKEISFKDVKGDEWYYKELQKSMYVEYIKGYDDNTFRANQNITRQEVAVILENLVQLELKEKNSLEKFSDTSNIPAWSRDALQLAVQKGYLAGYKDNSLKASNYITRAESVKVLSNLFGVIYNESGVYGPNDEDILEIDGNVTISVKDVTLQNMIIDGDLYLAEGIGEGDITLDNVTITGETTVKGGGENSIIIKNSSLANLIVIKKGGKIRIILEGNTNIVKTYVRSGVILENKSSNQSSFGDIEIIKIEPSSSVVLNGNFKNINVKATANIKLEKNTILDDLVIGKNISGVFINLLSTSKINNLTINTFIEVTNNGIIIKAVGPYAKDSIYETRLPENLRPAKRTSSSSVTRYTLTLSSNPVGGGALSGAGRYKSGETITVSAITAEGYEFLNWTDNDIEISTSSAFSFNMPPKNKTLTANFEGSGIASDFAGGNGTEGDPYQVANAVQLNNVRNYLDAHFIQTADIDLGLSPWNDGEGWDPIGDDDNRFSGSYNGNSYQIDGLTINRPTQAYIGLFGHTTPTCILSEIKLTSIDIKGNYDVGGLTGENRGKIFKCSAIGQINGDGHIGGLVGYQTFEGNNKVAIIKESFSNVNITATSSYVGGLVGSLNSGAIENSYAVGKVKGQQVVGGLVGQSPFGRIMNSYSIGEVIATEAKGGLIGRIQNVGESEIVNSYWDTETSKLSTSAAGTGYTSLQMKNSDNFNNWDFPNIWTINSTDNNGYPALAWQGFDSESDFAGGSGTESNPYQVANAVQLNNVRNYLDAHFIQIADIDLGVSSWIDGEGWDPIGTLNDKFTGKYNGNNKKIYGLTINRPSSPYIGLFGASSNTSVIKNLILIDVNIKGSHSTGSLVGRLEGLIEKCSVQGILEGPGENGGIVGSNTGTLKESFAVIDITSNGGYSGLGGLIGRNNGTVNNCYSFTSISFTSTNGNDIGGIVGYNEGIITSCYSVPQFSGDIYSKNGISKNYGGSVSLSYYDSTVSGLNSSDAGIPKTTEEMKSQSTYENWDFPNIWTINSSDNNGYPALAWQGFDSESDFAGGSGTESDPYQVETAEQLNNVRNYLDAHFIQIADIDLDVSPWNDGEGWVPIGTENDKFTGKYNGNNYSINNLTINESEGSYFGLFGFVGHYLTESELKNIVLNNINISRDSLHIVGGLVGRTESTVNIDNCYADGIINSTSLSGYAVGGLVGYNNGTLINSSSAVNVDINSSSESYTNKIGGLAGDNAGTIEKCFSSGDITGKEHIGGLVGWNGSGNILKSYSTGSINGDKHVGGLAGLAWGNIEESYATGNVIGATNIGGLIGSLAGKISNCYSSGDSSGGGLVGFFSGGGSPGKIVNCYSTGNSIKGGLLASIWESSSGHIIESSYWDTDTSGIATSAGGTGYTTPAMIKSTNSVSIYVDWDFTDIWAIEEGTSYPYLRNNEQSPHPVPPTP